MSRITRALERATKTRAGNAESDRSPIIPARPTSCASCDPSVFEVSEGGVKRDAVNSHIVTITDPYSHAAEEYRKLRARVLRATEKGFQNTIMVTSALDGEGKTITGINLAVAIAYELDHTVLLVDADLRKPSVHAYLGLQPERGLSEYLLSQAQLPDVLVKTGIGKLVLLPAGNPPENPAELIASERMRDMVLELKDRYRDRYIIIDSSPLLMTADSISLCDYVDGVIFVTRAGVTDPKTAVQALSLVKDHTILGTVFNDASSYPAKGRNSYYYRYGSSGAADAPQGGENDGTAQNT
jgi:protein-tyrosine kinase